MSDKNLINHTGKSAALLSLIEIGLGSILHSLRIPFSGHTLSLNQGFLMSRAVIQYPHAEGRRFIPANMGVIAALLKSLSPAGKKLTPMLAISSQGLLYSLGVMLFGVNPVGIVTGMVFMSLWAFLQPVLLYFLLYGKTIIHIADYFYDKLAKVFPINTDVLITVLLVVVTVKVSLAVIVGLLACYLPQDLIESQYRKVIRKAKGSPRYRKLLDGPSEKIGFWQNARLALGDLFNPLFIFSLLLTIFFFIFAKTESTQMIWILMRPIAIGYLLFLIVRLFPLERVFEGRDAPFSRSMQSALKHLKEF